MCSIYRLLRVHLSSKQFLRIQMTASRRTRARHQLHLPYHLSVKTDSITDAESLKPERREMFRELHKVRLPSLIQFN